MTSGTVFRSPPSGSVAAATTPARLAREHDDVRWRRGGRGGGLQVAVRDGNRVERLRVLDDGSTSLIEGYALRPIAEAQAFAKWGFLAALMFLGLGWIP